MNLILYGPPASGKTTIGQLVAQRLGREFIDGDVWIENHWSRSPASYFESGEWTLFRAREGEAYRTLAALEDLVIAPGGGALLDPHNRAALEGTGVIICLTASLESLLGRLEGGPIRPLFKGDPPARLAALLKEREKLYCSFAVQVNTDGQSPEAIADEVIAKFQAARGLTRFEMGECSALFGHGLLARLPELIAEKGLRPPFLLIADSNTASLYGESLSRSLPAPLVTFPAGEAHKNLDTIRELYTACVAHGMERGGTLFALGGGVAGDTVGFVAASFMRGVRWVNLPTTVLAMSDASIGGKVGVDLPEGKNLVGAFHPPALILGDYDTLPTLPEIEVRCGLAEIVKSALIADPDLFYRLGKTYDLENAIARSAAVKVGIVNADPFERSERAKLNIGHTIGHGVEAASGFVLRHGEAISIGTVAESCLAHRMGLTEDGLTEEIKTCLEHLNLPTRAPGLKPEAIRKLMGTDKKKAGGKIKFALPRKVGEVEFGIEVDEKLLMEILEESVHG